MKDVQNVEVWARHVAGHEQRHRGGKAKAGFPGVPRVFRAVTGSETRPGQKLPGSGMPLSPNRANQAPLGLLHLHRGSGCLPVRDFHEVHCPSDSSLPWLIGVQNSTCSPEHSWCDLFSREQSLSLWLLAPCWWLGQFCLTSLLNDVSLGYMQSFYTECAFLLEYEIQIQYDNEV